MSLQPADPAVSPVARRVAAQLGVELARVQGSGPSGRIIKRDVLAAHQPMPVPADYPEDLPAPAEALEWLQTMHVIRRFEERAGESYAKGKVGGFLHLAIGEEAAIVGTARALRDQDYLIGTYRTHGHALARGSDPRRVMAELYGRESGTSHGRGGSMHIFDHERRFMGGYGIVGGNIPIGAGLALATRLRGGDEVTVCTFGDGAANNGTFGETLNMAALWKLPIVFVIENNLFGMGTSLARHTAQTDLARKGIGYGVEGARCDGMDPLDTSRVMSEAIEAVRSDHQPRLVEIVTYRFRGHSMADPEEYRDKSEVEQWKARDPLITFGARLQAAGILDEDAQQQMDALAQQEIDEATAWADAAPHPQLDQLYRDTYVESPNTRGALFVKPGSEEAG